MQTPINHTWNLYDLFWSFMNLIESHWLPISVMDLKGLAAGQLHQLDAKSSQGFGGPSWSPQQRSGNIFGSRCEQLLRDLVIWAFAWVQNQPPIHINNQDCNLLFCTYYEYSCLLPLVLLIKSPGCPDLFDVFDHEYHEYYIVYEYHEYYIV